MSKNQFRLLLLLAINAIAIIGIFGIGSPQAALAILAGDPNGTPADSPANRIDPNVPTSPFAGVGSVQKPDGGLCSGTAITSNHILTAAHCFDAGTPTFYLNYDSIPVAYTGTANIYPSYNAPFGDLAILSLNQSLPSYVPTYQLFGSPIPLGSVITMVGYGLSGDGISGANVNADRTVKRIGQNNVDGFIDSNQNLTNSNSSLFAFDFDGPTGSPNYLGGPTGSILSNNLDTGFTLGNDLESTFYAGDSGGPSFIKVGGSYYLAGVNTVIFTLGSNPSLFSSGGGGVDISGYQPWINSVTGVPFEFSLFWGISLLGIWFGGWKLKKILSKR